ncbi:MAG: ThuA domain-containing protein [Polyangiaceae bacterium]|nr:ThuA domain-containing protein [Polyangiaceae bacterium]
MERLASLIRRWVPVVGVIGTTGWVGCSSESASSTSTNSGGSGGATVSTSTTTETVTNSTSETVETPPALLLFSRTTGFRHDSIPAAINAIKARAEMEGWEVTATEDPAFFTDGNLSKLNVVAFVLTSGDVLDDSQQAAFQAFIQSGGGFIGVHSATDTEYDWAWYGGLVGAYFKAHPAIQQADIRVERPSHAATHGLADVWSRTDEWYAFQQNPRADVTVLLSLDEASYGVGDTAMGDHPIAWYHGWEGGRAFYTALGHTVESWSEPAFMDHVWGAVEWAGGKDWDHVVVSEFDGVEKNGTWQPLQAPGDFPFEVSQNALVMTDVTGQNQHVVRQDVELDPSAAYVMEGLFTIAAGTDNLNSFCFDLNLDSASVDQNKINTWAMNVDLGAVAGQGVMKHMGFVNGGFNQIGETVIDWGQKGNEYLLRVAVNVDENGNKAPAMMTVTVFDKGVEVERFTVNYEAFPYQPPAGGKAKIGANTHGTNWSLRSLRVYTFD